MRNAINTALALVALAAPAIGAPPIRPIEQPLDSSLLAVAEWGDSLLLTREVKIEVDSPRWGNANAVGSLLVMFDRSTGYYFRDIGWSRKGTPGYPSYMEQLKDAHLGVTSKRIWVFYFQPVACMLEILQGAEKAESLDDAESKALTWAAGHVRELEQRKSPLNRIAGARLILPLGKHADIANEGTEFVPETLLNITLHDGLWEFTFDGYQRRDKWYHPPGETKHLKAKYTLNSSTWEQSPRLACVDDKSQEIPCP